MQKIKKVVLIGAGAMGSFFAPRLYNWLDKGNFFVMANAERKTRLETRGLTINGINYKFPVIKPNEKTEPADLIIIAVKSTCLNQAIADIKNQVGPNTLILAVLNGIDIEERVAAVYGWEHVLYSYMRVSIAMKNGHVDYNPVNGFVHFGEAINDSYSPRVLAVKELFDECHISYQINEDMIHGIWNKFISNIGENMTCALLGISYGAFSESEHANFIRHAAMNEVIEIATAKGITIEQSELDAQESIIRNMSHYDNKPSTLQDIESRKPTEVDIFSGTVTQLGKDMGIPTPYNEFLYHAIKVIEEKNANLI